MRCDGCMYWSRLEIMPNCVVGECRRRSPTVHGPSNSVAQWPITREGQFCGEFEAIQAPASVTVTVGADIQTPGD